MNSSEESALENHLGMFGITQKLQLLRNASEKNNNDKMNGNNNDGEVEDKYADYPPSGDEDSGGQGEEDAQEQQYEDDYEQYQEEAYAGEEEDDEYDYPDISEFVQTEFEEGCGEDDEEDRGLPPADMRFMPQAGYPPEEQEEEEEDEEETSTAALIQSLPPGTFIQQTKRPSGSPSSSSARTSTTLNNLLLLRQNGATSQRKSVSAATALGNALLLMEQQQQQQQAAEDENGHAEDYFGGALSLIVQQQQQQQGKQRPKNRGFRAPQLSNSALLEQLQSPAYTKPNILSRKLITGQNSQYGGRGGGSELQNGSRPPPRLQPRPGANTLVVQQPQPALTLESLLRKAQSGQKQMPRLQTLSPTKSSAQNYIIDGRKLSFKTAAANQMRQQKSPTRSLESLMLSHQKSQLQQQLASRQMRDNGIMVGNLHIRQVSQPVIRSNGNSLLRGSITGQGQKNVPRCHVCRKTFATNQVLQRHVASVHGFTFGDVDVSKLGGAVAQLQQQQQPKEAANGGGAHRCRVCYRTFGSLESLRAHALNHEGEFKCRACRRGFPSWEILEQHESTHKKYECRWCEKYFMNSGNLKAHERIHTGERPYKCADCPKGFKQLGGLQYHLKTNPTHRPQKYKLEDQDPNQQPQSSPQDYSISNSLTFNGDVYAEEASGDGDAYMEDDDQEGYLDLATSASM